jgi:hypothetical protein
MITIFIPTRNNPKGVLTILTELKPFTGIIDFEVVIYINPGLPYKINLVDYPFVKKIVNNNMNIGALGSINTMLTTEDYDYCLFLSDNDKYNFKEMFRNLLDSKLSKYSFFKLHPRVDRLISVSSHNELLYLTDKSRFPDTLLISGWGFKKESVERISDKIHANASTLAPHLLSAVLLTDLGEVGIIIPSQSTIGVSVDRKLHWDIEYIYFRLISNFRILLGSDSRLLKQITSSCYPRSLISPMAVGLRCKTFKEVFFTIGLFNFLGITFKLGILTGFIFKEFVSKFLKNTSLHKKIEGYAERGQERS